MINQVSVTIITIADSSDEAINNREVKHELGICYDPCDRDSIIHFIDTTNSEISKWQRVIDNWNQSDMFGCTVRIKSVNFVFTRPNGSVIDEVIVNDETVIETSRLITAMLTI